jgi:non-homologous end joining protein Ku
MTDNPIADFEEYNKQCENRLKQLPICSECGEHIQDDLCYEIYGNYICDECMENFRIHTPNFEE